MMKKPFRYLSSLAILAVVAALAVPESADAQLFRRRFRKAQPAPAAQAAQPAESEGPDCPHVKPRTQGSVKTFWPFTPEESTALVPSGGPECNAYLAGKLGAFARANFTTKSGTTVDVYQAVGKQRIVWSVFPADQWQAGLLRTITQKATTGAHTAGLCLVGFGVDAECAAACVGAGARLSLLDPETGELSQLVPAKPTPQPEPEPAPSPEPPAPDAEPAVDPTPVVDPVTPVEPPADEAAIEPAVPDVDPVVPLPAPDVNEELPLPAPAEE